MLLRSAQEHICTLNVSMRYFELVHLIEPMDRLDEDAPHLRLPKENPLLLAGVDHFKQVPLVCVVHHNTTGVTVQTKTYQSEDVTGSKKASRYEITLGCWMLARMRTSLMALMRSFSLICAI